MGLADQPSKSHPRTEQDGLEVAARQAMVSAALRLGIDAVEFARRAGDAELAEVILELRLARHALAAADKARIEMLLRQLGVLP